MTAPDPTPTGTFISGWATHHPSEVVTNADLVARVDTSHQWLDERIGIRERRVVGTESVADLCEIVGRRALDRAGTDAADLDLVVGTSAFDDMEMPAVAARVSDRLGATAHAFDVKAACSGWVVGLDVAAAFLASGRADRALVVAGESTARHIDADDRATSVFFGDASVAAVLQRTAPPVGLEVVGFERRADSSRHDLVEVPVGGWFRTDAGATRRWVEDAVETVTRRLLDDAGVAVADVRAFAFHQANLRLIESVSERLGVTAEQHWHNVTWAGNTASAAGPSALFEGLDHHRDGLVDGDLVATVVVGAGLNAIGVLLRWIDTAT